MRYYRPEGFPPIVKNLIIINVLVFLAQMTLTQYEITNKIMLYPLMTEELRLILIELGNRFSGESRVLDAYADGYHFQPYQIATHMFAHGGFMHILFNMFGLYMFGRILENVWGPKRFLLFYILCGVGAALAHLTIQYFRCQELLDAYLINDPSWQEMIGAAAPALGASGAVMGIFAAFAYLFPNTELFIMFIPFPIKAKWAVLGLAAFDLFSGSTGLLNTGIAHFAHLGGAITGFIIVLIWNKTDKQRFY